MARASRPWDHAQDAHATAVLAAEKLDVALIICDRHRSAAVADIASDASAFAEQLHSALVPERPHGNSFYRRRCHQMKSAARRHLQRDGSPARLELIGSAGSKFAVEENVARRIRSEDARGVDAEQLNIAGSPNVRAN